MSKFKILSLFCASALLIAGIISISYLNESAFAQPPVDLSDTIPALGDEWPGASICGETDDRYPIEDHRAARMGGCSAVMLEGGVFMSAGHCFVGPELLELEFRVPLSDEEGNITRSDPEDIWVVDRLNAIVGIGAGRDYAVFRVFPNSSLQFPEDVYGPGFETSSPELSGAKLAMVIGYGRSQRGGGDRWSQTLRAADGPIAWTTDQHLFYPIDTEIASSGSGVVCNDKLIGVHTDGGCTTEHEVNRGYRVDQPHIITAIELLRAPTSLQTGITGYGK